MPESKFPFYAVERKSDFLKEFKSEVQLDLVKFPAELGEEHPF